jgi:hypothetical protein
MRRPRALGLLALSVAVLAGLTGCNSAITGSASDPGKAAPSAGNDAASARHTANQLRDALLTSAAGMTRPAAPEAGTYGSLPGVQDTKAMLKGVTIIPAKCARAATTGLDSPAFSSAPAAVVSFQRSQRAVSEALLAPAPGVTAQALGHPVPAGCGHYRARAGGRTFNYAVKEEPAPHLGLGAREIRVHASGAATTDVWLVIYRTSGYVGAVMLRGSGSTGKQAQAIARQAYARAQQTLH